MIAVLTIGMIALLGVKDSLIVVRVLILIGCLTGLWRAIVPFLVCCAIYTGMSFFVPLSTFGVGPGALLMSFYLWLLPLLRIINGRKAHKTT